MTALLLVYEYITKIQKSVSIHPVITWMRASDKWQSYEMFPESANLEVLLLIINKDSYGCFKG